MKKIVLLILAFLACILLSCDKDNNDKAVNTIQIKDGEFSGYNYTFTPNLGFWSPVNETTRYIHLVLGDDDNQASGGENVMSILFYDNGASMVLFPSPEGQWIRFGLNIDGLIYYFAEESAELTITQSGETYFEGILTGQFVDISDSSRKISFTMNLSLPMQQI